MELNDFFVSVFSTFLGVILALVGERFYDKYKNKEESKNLKKAFHTEMENIIKIIEKIKSKPDLIWLNPIKIPIWESTVSTNQLSLICTEAWYPDLLSLYDEIKDYNEWQLLRTKLYYYDKEIMQENIKLDDIILQIEAKIKRLIDVIK